MNYSENKGFSLVEIALVLILFGFVSSTILLALKTYTTQTRIDNTRESLRLTNDAIAAFATENGGRYPCPALLNIGPNDARYGDEAIVNDATAIARNATLTAISNIGKNDIDDDGLNDDYVYGAVPFKTILNSDNLPGITSPATAIRDFEFAAKHAVDGWGNKLVYVVSRHLCDPDSVLAANPQGVLDVVTDQQCEEMDAAGNPTGIFHQQSVLPGSCGGSDRRYAQFIVLSHGPNTRGAYNMNGIQIEDCLEVAALLPAGDAGRGTEGDNNAWFNGNISDRKNCKYERNLVDPSLTNEGEFFYGLRSEGTEDTTYDDFIKFYYEDNFRIFSSAEPLQVPEVLDGFGNVVIPAYEISRMKNVNTGQIGIGVQDPDEMVHVDGDVQAFDIYAEEYCAEISSGKCISAELLGGAGMACPPGESIVSIEDGKVNCADPFAGLTFTCSGPGEKLQGIRSDGSVICIVP